MSEDDLLIRLDRRHSTPLPTDFHLRRAYPEFWQHYDHRFPDSQHPLLSQVALELYRRWSYLCAPPSAVWPAGLDSPVEQQADRIQGYWLSNLSLYMRLHSEVAELTGLLFRPLTRQQRAEAIKNELTRLRQAPLSYSAGKVAEDLLKRSFAGRPANKRGLALLALEKRMSDPELTWEQIAKSMNYAGDAEYQSPKNRNRACLDSLTEVLPAEVRVVKRILRKYGILRYRRA